MLLFKLCPSMASMNPAFKPSIGSSMSGFLQRELPLQSSNFRGLDSKSRLSGVYARAATEKSIHDFAVKAWSVNTFWGRARLLAFYFSAPNSGLDLIAGFQILAFPCNQFGGQEPGSNPQINQFACTRFKAEFPIFDKVEVNGANAAPVYQFLKSNPGGFLGDLIKWNFEKFSVGKNGKVVERYPPTTSPFQIEKDIKKLIAA